MTKTITTLVTVCLCWGFWGAAGTADEIEPADDSSEAWSLRPLPELKQLSLSRELLVGDSSQQPIDRYILRSLQDHQLSPNKAAVPHRQVRRLSLMLTGLPSETEHRSSICE